MSGLVNLKSLPVLWRWRILIAGTLLLFFAALRFNIAKTIGVIRDYNSVRNDAAKIPQDFNAVDYLRDDTTKETDSKYVLRYMTDYCDSNRISIREIAQTYSPNKDSIIIETNRILLEGSYESVLRLVSDLEEKKITLINSANFELTKDRSTGKYSLLSLLFIKKIYHEK